MPRKEIRLDKIRWDATDLQAREGDMDAATIAHYADRMNEGEADSFPPIILFYDGTDYWPADGWYRGRAAEKAGFGTIAADVRDGTREDAWEYAHTEANHSHGKPFTNADRRKKVAAYIKRHIDYSDNRIAEKCHVPYGLVQKVRASLPDHVRAREPDRRTGADGKSYPAKRSVGASAEVPTEAESTDATAEQPASPVKTPVSGRASVVRDMVPVREDKPKRPAPFVDRFDSLFGPLVRFLDEAAAHYGHRVEGARGVEHKAMLSDLDSIAVRYRRWREAA